MFFVTEYLKNYQGLLNMIEIMKHKYAHIYVFVQNDMTLPLMQTLFYIGSTKDIRERMYAHVRDMMPCLPVDHEFPVKDKRVKMYKYIQQNVGYNRFSVYILDHVPIHERKTYEKMYYDIMTDQSYNLYNSVSPTPENPNLIDDDRRLHVCNTFQMFIDKNLDMTVEEDLLNGLISQNIKIFNPDSDACDKVLFNRLKKQIVHMKEQLKSYTDTCEQHLMKIHAVTRENDLLQTLNDHLTFRVETLSKNIDSFSNSSLQQSGVVIYNTPKNDIDVNKLSQEKEALLICIAELKSKLQMMEKSNILVKTTAVHILDQKAHEQNVQNVQPQQIVSISNTVDKKSKLPCKYCNKKISRNNMAAHVRVCKKCTKPTYKELEQQFENYKDIVENSQKTI